MRDHYCLIRDILVKSQMIDGLSAPAVYGIYVQIHYSIKHIEIRRQIHKTDAIFWIIHI